MLFTKRVHAFRKNVGSNLSTDTYRLNFSFDKLIADPVRCLFSRELQNAILRIVHPFGKVLIEPIHPEGFLFFHIAYHFDCAGQRNAVVSFVESDSGFRVFDKIFCLLRACSR